MALYEFGLNRIHLHPCEDPDEIVEEKADSRSNLLARTFEIGVLNVADRSPYSIDIFL